MIKRSVLSMFGGALLGLLLIGPVGAVVGSHCAGYCEDLDGCTYAGCSMHFDSNGHVDVVACGYICTIQ